MLNKYRLQKILRLLDEKITFLLLKRFNKDVTIDFYKYIQIFNIIIKYSLLNYLTTKNVYFNVTITAMT